STNIFTNEGMQVVELTVTDYLGCKKTLGILVEVMPNTIKVYDDLYTVEELVKDILIDNECAQITNTTSLTGTDFDDVNGIGYFEGEFTDFPIDKGVLLSSGKAKAAEGPETGIQANGGTGWLGDADVDDIIDDIEGPGAPSSRNASIIEFDFV